MMLSPARRDLIGRAAMTLYASACATLKVIQIVAMHGSVLDHVANVASLGFMLMIVATTFTRLPPVSSAPGISPRVVALLGTFVTLTFVALPPVEIAPGVKVASDILVIVGFSLCIWCLWWLGRSFSIMAQARRLVIKGPYRLIRHPLYACEGVALAGLILSKPSWAAITIVASVLVFQYLRMMNEEKVLRETFPEYGAYAQMTPMLIPCLGLTPGRQYLIGSGSQASSAGSAGQVADVGGGARDLA